MTASPTSQLKCRPHSLVVKLPSGFICKASTFIFLGLGAELTDVNYL